MDDFNDQVQCEEVYDHEPYNEYNDPDATSCANGDYNTYGENQIVLDQDEEDDDKCFDDLEYGDEGYWDDEPDLGVSDDNWACGTLEL